MGNCLVGKKNTNEKLKKNYNKDDATILKEALSMRKLKTVVDKMTPDWYQRLINIFDNLTYKLRA